MAVLKEQLRSDLTTALKARDEVTLATLRMALAAITGEEVAGEAARQLDDAEVLRVLTREARKRRESEEAYAAAGREELAARERAEAAVLARYLPTQLDEDELTRLVDEVVDEIGTRLGERPGMRQMGQVMKLATARAGGRADGARLAAAVRSRLQT